MAIGRTNAGGGGAGGTLSVTGVAGSTVTVSNGDKSYTRTLGSSGTATFKGLASGTWTVTMTDGTQTAVARTVKITSDYTTITAYFAATINVTYPAGSTCTATDGTTMLTAPDTSGAWACIVPNAGTWTVTITDGTDTATDTVSITTDGQTAAVKLSYFNGIIYDAGAVNPKIEMEMLNSSENIYSVTYGTSFLTMASKGGKGAAFLAAKVDVTNFSTLNISYISAAFGYVAINKTADVAYNVYPDARTRCSYWLNSEPTTTSLDISLFDGEYYVGLWEQQWNDASYNSKIYKIWLE